MLGVCKTLQLQSFYRFYSKAAFYERISKEISSIKDLGLFKAEQVLMTRQSSEVKVATSKLSTVESEGTSQMMINFCANNYLGLSSHPEVIRAGKEILASRGAGMSSVRFICGTQDLHKKLESRLSEFHQTEDTILYTSCFDANAGLFETLFKSKDAIISDTLNHASIIDGIRLCKAQRFRYKHNDMDDLERQLEKARDDESSASASSRTVMIATDGVFSMDGDFANLPKICELAKKYDAIVYVDDSHATGFIGERGRGTAEHFGLQDQVDVICSTLGKALGGSSGGYTTGRAELITLLRQRSRPYLFSNSLPPVITAFALCSLKLIDEQPELSNTLFKNTKYFRSEMAKVGYNLMGNAKHPICPVFIGDAVIADKMAKEMRSRGILVIAFSYPVVPQGTARIRVQISAAHTKDQIDTAIEAFSSVGKQFGIIQ